MVGKLKNEIIGPLLDAMPAEISFLDDADCVAYFNKGEKREIFPRPAAAIGRNVKNCHPPKSIDKVMQIIGDFRNNRRDVAEFWIDHGGKKIYIRYFAVRDENGKFLGTLEFSQDITQIRKLEGEKRLL